MAKVIRTRRQIDSELAKLRRLADLVPERTFFGDSNRDAVNAQAEVLKCYWGESRIHDRFGHDDRLLDQALEAFHWRNGDSDEAPSAGWQELIDIKAKPRGKRGGK